MKNMNSDQLLKELNRIKSSIKYLQKNSLCIGLPKDAITISKDGEEASVVEYGIRHEYGIGVPIRSWLREPIFIHMDKIKEFVSTQITLALNGINTPYKSYSFIGIWIVQLLKSMFDTGGEGRWKALSPVTVAKKGFDTILVQTGNLRRMITYVIRKN